MPASRPPIAQGRKPIATPRYPPSAVDLTARDTPPPPPTSEERLAKLAPDLQAAFRIRRRFASREVTDEDILRGLEQAKGRTLGGALGTVGRAGLEAGGLAGALAPIPFTKVPFFAAQMGIGAVSLALRGRSPLRSPAALLEAEAKLPLWVSFPAEFAVGLGGAAAGAARMARTAAGSGWRPGDIALGTPRIFGVNELAQAGLPRGGPGFFTPKATDFPARMARQKVREQFARLEAQELPKTRAELATVLGRVAVSGEKAQAELEDVLGRVVSSGEAERRAGGGAIITEAAGARPPGPPRGEPPSTSFGGFPVSPFQEGYLSPAELRQEAARRAASAHVDRAEDFFTRPDGISLAGGADDPLPNLILPSSFVNTPPGRMPPFTPALADALAAHPVNAGKAMAITRLLDTAGDAIRRYTRDYPLIDRMLNWTTLQHWKPMIQRVPTVNAAVERATAMQQTVILQDEPLIFALAQGLKDAFGGSKTGLKFKPGAKVAKGYGHEGHIQDIIQHPDDYALNAKQKAWLAQHKGFSDQQRKLELDLGLNVEERPFYISQLTDPREPEFNFVPIASRRFAAKPGFVKERHYQDLRQAWAAGQKLRHEGYDQIMRVRSAAGARAMGEKWAKDIAQAYGDDEILNQVSAFFTQGRARTAGLEGGITALTSALTNTVLGPDLLAVLGQQLFLGTMQNPAGVLGKTIPGVAPRGIANLVNGLKDIMSPGGRLLPKGSVPEAFLEQPLHGLGYLKLMVPQFLDPDYRRAFLRENLDVMTDMVAHGTSPVHSIPGMTGAVTDFSPIGRVSSFFSNAQFAGLLTPVKVMHYKLLTEHLITGRRSLLSPVDFGKFGQDGHLPGALASRLKAGSTDFEIKAAIGDFLDDVYGGVSAAKWGLSEWQAQMERMVGIAPGWLRANIDLLTRTGTDTVEGALARDFLARSMMMYVLLGEAVSIGTTGEGMNVTDPSKGDFGAWKVNVKLGPIDIEGGRLQPIGRLTGTVRMTAGPVFQSIHDKRLNLKLALKGGFAKLNPAVTMATDLIMDKDVFSGRAITQLGNKDDNLERAWFAFKHSLPIMGQNLLEQGELGSFDAATIGLEGLGFSFWSMSPKRRAVMGALERAAVEAGVPADQARTMVSAGEAPTRALDQDGKYVLTVAQRAEAERKALAYAKEQDPTLTAEDVRSRGYPKLEDRKKAWARTTASWEKQRESSDIVDKTFVNLDKRRADTISGKLKTKEDGALSGKDLREAIQDTLLKARDRRWAEDDSMNRYAEANNLQELLRQLQDDGLSKLQEDDLRRSLFLYGVQSPKGEEKAGYLSRVMYDPDTGAVRFDARDSFRAEWEGQVGAETVKRWLTEGKEKAPPHVQAYFDGQDAYRIYFELREKMQTGASPFAQKFLAALEVARFVGDGSEAALQKVAPMEVKRLDRQITFTKEAMRRGVPGLDNWLLAYGYVSVPIGSR